MATDKCGIYLTVILLLSAIRQLSPKHMLCITFATILTCTSSFFPHCSRSSCSVRLLQTCPIPRKRNLSIRIFTFYHSEEGSHLDSPFLVIVAPLSEGDTGKDAASKLASVFRLKNTTHISSFSHLCREKIFQLRHI